MIDIVREIEAVKREVGEGTVPAGVGRSVTLEREYPAPIDDVWDALTNPERIGRWFLPISGDYRLGGRYQFEGNAGGRIVECDQPQRLKVTWEYGPATDVDASIVEVRLSPVGDGMTRSRARAHRGRAGRDVGGVRAGRRRRRLGGRPAGALAPSSGRTATGRSGGLAAVAGRTRLLAPEQRGVGRREPGRRRGSRGGRPRRREHDDLLCAGAGGRVVGRCGPTPEPSADVTSRRDTSRAGRQVHVADSAQGSGRSRSRPGRSEGDREPMAAATALGRTGRCDLG